MPLYGRRIVETHVPTSAQAAALPTIQNAYIVELTAENDATSGEISQAAHERPACRPVELRHPLSTIHLHRGRFPPRAIDIVAAAEERATYGLPADRTTVESIIATGRDAERQGGDRLDR